jgi:hypothetical protein
MQPSRKDAMYTTITTISSIQLIFKLIDKKSTPSEERALPIITPDNFRVRIAQL